ncbi:hypothetical protein D3C87_1658100 [compost metagenome]
MENHVATIKSHDRADFAVQGTFDLFNDRRVIRVIRVVVSHNLDDDRLVAIHVFLDQTAQWRSQNIPINPVLFCDRDKISAHINRTCPWEAKDLCS